MSVLILGAAMPKSCAECHAFLDDTGDYPMCRITGETRGYTFNVRAKQMDMCPLRPLPDKHGRLIDADVLESGLKTLYKIGDIEPIQWTYFRVTLEEQKSVIEKEGEVV